MNEKLDAIVGLMPFMHEIFERLIGSIGFGSYDAYKGFWQFLLHEDCRELFSFMTPDGIYTPTRVVQGSLDASLHFQCGISECLGDLWKTSHDAWVDDILHYAKSWDAFLLSQREFFTRMSQKGVKLSAKKTRLYVKEIKWCGRIITPNGIKQIQIKRRIL